jgi:hypothetical protein
MDIAGIHLILKSKDIGMPISVATVVVWCMPATCVLE